MNILTSLMTRKQCDDFTSGYKFVTKQNSRHSYRLRYNTLIFQRLTNKVTNLSIFGMSIILKQELQNGSQNFDHVIIHIDGVK